VDREVRRARRSLRRGRCPTCGQELPPGTRLKPADMRSAPGTGPSRGSTPDDTDYRPPALPKFRTERESMSDAGLLDADLDDASPPNDGLPDIDLPDDDDPRQAFLPEQ
jgi:hypothetical protein